MERVPPFALLVLMALIFALGVGFDSIAGWAQTYNTPDVASTCRNAPNITACATLASAEATATIARWTRWDAILSIFTGFAAIFAYLAYRESKGARVAAEDQARASRESLEYNTRRDREQLDRARAEIAMISIEWSIRPQHDYDLFDDSSSSPIKLRLVGNGRNIRPTEAKSVYLDLGFELRDSSAESRALLMSGEIFDVPLANLIAGQETLEFDHIFDDGPPWSTYCDREKSAFIDVTLTLKWSDTFDHHHERVFIGWARTPRVAFKPRPIDFYAE